MLSFDIPIINNISTSNNILTTTTIELKSNEKEEEKEQYGTSMTCLLMNIYDYRPKTRYISNDTYYILDYIALYPKDRLLEIIFSNHRHRSNFMRFRLRDDKSVENAKQMKDRIKHTR